MTTFLWVVSGIIVGAPLYLALGIILIPVVRFFNGANAVLMNIIDRKFDTSRYQKNEIIKDFYYEFRGTGEYSIAFFFGPLERMLYPFKLLAPLFFFCFFVTTVICGFIIRFLGKASLIKN